MKAYPIRIHRSSGARTARGMTLIELCIAVALLALITIMSYRGLDSLSRASDRLIEDGERWQSAALFFARLGSDVAQPAQRPIRVGEETTPTPATATAEIPAAASTSLPTWLGRPDAASDAMASDGNANIADTAAALEFTRKSAAGRDEVRLGYRLRGARVELLVWPVLDRAQNSRPEIYTLLDGVSALHFRHLDAAGNWQDAWPPAGTAAPATTTATANKTGEGAASAKADEALPRAIEVDLTLRDGTHLHRVFALPS